MPTYCQRLRYFAYLTWALKEGWKWFPPLIGAFFMFVGLPFWVGSHRG